MDSSKSQYSTATVLSNNKVSPLEGGHSKKIGVMWTLKHEIISPKFYELPIKKNLKDDTGMDFLNFYNNIKMCISVVTRLQEYLITDH